ncbi:MAG: IS5 family transposase [Burkholderiales bacterium]|nr:IS5 family transposase [Burkholderiales bacterium]
MIKKSGNNMSKGKKWRKGKYKVINWWTYNKDLKKRGYLTIWFTQEGIEQLIEEEASVKFRGRQREYSDTAIQAMYTIRQVFNLRLRQTEGFTKSILKIIKINLPIPDYTTVSRRVRELSVDFITMKPGEKINLILDSTGIKIVGEKEWANHKYGTRQRKIWRKLHIGVTDDGNIVAGEVTTLRRSDIAAVPILLKQVTTDIEAVVGDGAYHQKRMEDYMKQNQNCESARFIGPPNDGSKNYGNRLKVEENFSRYKKIIGNKFKAQHFLGGQNEAKISLLILNIMKNLGMPQTIRVA